MSGRHSIGDVSRIAGIPKNLLRMWERRYGYPKPERDRNGDRIYSNEELEKLVAIRHLMGQGCRPGKLVGLKLSQLRSLMSKAEADLDIDRLIALLKTDDTLSLRGHLQQQLAALGLRSFVHRLMAPATSAVGDAWARGELEIYQEHLYTELITALVREALPAHYQMEGSPRIMLTTLQGEPHALGLLMAEALAWIGGAQVIPFGTEMPLRDIVNAITRHEIDVLGLSFSCHFGNEDALAMLSGLRHQVDSGVAIWAGGAAISSVSATMPEGVKPIISLVEWEQALVAWRSFASLARNYGDR